MITSFSTSCCDTMFEDGTETPTIFLSTIAIKIMWNVLKNLDKSS